MMAALMAISAFGTDIMLTVLPEMNAAMHQTIANRQQWIIVVYTAGMGLTQLVYGPLADAWGRKPVLLAGLILFILSSLLVAGASSFEQLLAARFIQGAAAASSRVLVGSIVRDKYAGRTMARVMSLAFVVFLGVPILAPTL
ncbi:MAG: MFS transporter, partial [Alphaproteobacteria bacterium]|nr:MFS transporter [Alphaproteobacteria bacterium]